MPRFVLDSGKRVLTVKIDNDIVDNSDIYGWYFGGITPDEIDAGLDQYRGQFDMLVPVINSNGGSVTAGMAIRNSFIRLAQEGVSVEPVITGVAASIASVIALSGKKPKVYDGSYLMIHNPYTFTVGDAAELRNVADTLEKMREDLLSIYVKSSSLDVKSASEKMDAETWFSISEMVSLGFAVPAPVANGAMNSSVSYFKSPFSAKLKAIPEEISNKMIDLKNEFPITPAVPENREGGSMSKLSDFLNANPDAKAEHEKALAEAKGTVEPSVTEAPAAVPVDAGKGDFKARAKAILNSSVYGASIKALAGDVLCGDADVSALNAAVAAYDATMEAMNSGKAQSLTQTVGETPTETPVAVAEQGSKIGSNEDALKYIDALKKGTAK